MLAAATPAAESTAIIATAAATRALFLVAADAAPAISLGVSRPLAAIAVSISHPNDLIVEVHGAQWPSELGRVRPRHARDGRLAEPCRCHRPHPLRRKARADGKHMVHHS